MLVIGLCGGSGSGKSTVAGLLKEHNILHVDTDSIYRSLISSPSECTKELTDEFGVAIINTDGSINRPGLAEIVFNDKNKHTALNRIAHKHVLNVVREIISSSSEYLAVCVDAPMLFESGFDKECDIIVAVTAPLEDRIDRIIKRDNITREAAIKRINSQLTDSELESKADFVIKNENNTSMLASNIDELVDFINNKLK